MGALLVRRLKYVGTSVCLLIVALCSQHDERERQDKLRSQCLAYWDVPDKRPSDVRGKLDQSFVFTKLSGSIPFGKAQFTILPEVSYCTKDQLRNILNYRGVFFGGDLILLLGLGLSDVRYVPLKGNKFDFSGSTWDKVSNRPDWKDLRFPIPAETLVVGEIVEEFHGETQRKIKALHIIDAYALGKVVVGGLPYEERIRRARKFARAIRQNPPASVVRVKPVHKAREFLADISRLQPFKPRNMRHCITLAEQLADNALYGVHGMHFIKIVTDPWTMVWSKTSGSPYCFNPKDGKQTMDLVPGVFANSTLILKDWTLRRDALNNWIVWKWSSGNVIDQRTQTQVKDTMHELLEHAKFPKSTPKH